MSSLLSILGETKKINIGEDKEIVLRDPFLGSMQDLIRYCLNELSQTLHTTVCYTYNNLLDKRKQAHFFLTGYGERKDWNTLRRKLYDDPSNCVEGKDLKWLLKNFRWNYRKYALYLNIYEDTFDDITGFFLYDVSQALYTADPFECNKELVSDCFDAALEIVEAVSESQYYKDIQENILRHKENLEAIIPTITERDLLKEKHALQQKQNGKNLDTESVLTFLRSKTLIDSLKKEADIISDNPIEKPLTNFFLHSVIARFHSNDLAGDSGIVDDLTSILSNVSTPISKPNDLSNQQMDGSMVIINSLESTPIVDRSVSLKPLNALLNSVSNKRTRSSNDENSSDKMDGSFLLV